LLKLFNKKKFKINLSWLLFDKLFRASINILLSIFLARNLGPQSFGILNYLLAFIFLFVALSSLGMSPVLINQIIKKKNINYHIYIMNAYYLRFIFSLVNYFIFIFLVKTINEDIIYYNFSLILGMIIMFKSCEVIFSYFEAKSLSKFIVVSQFIGLLSSGSVILYSINTNLDEIYIYYALLLDVVIVFLLINFFYLSNFKNIFVGFNILILKKIIKKSLPVLISSLSIILYMRIDQIMIKSLVDEYNLGIYSVSVRFIEIFHFIPKIIMISFLPILLLSKKYKIDLLNLNSIIFKFSLILMISIFLSSDFLIPFVFSDVYSESVSSTKVLSLSLIFVFIGVANEHWYVSNNLQRYYAIYVLLGAVVNIFLNYFMILKFGIIGAAYSTVITYFLIIFIFDNLNKKTRSLLIIKLNSLFRI
tara:strand:- start:3190 stop:4449 length:1260 start_codon:yes stop_codon:yes gene_type:complete